MADQLPGINQDPRVFAPDGAPNTANVSELGDSELNQQIQDLVGPLASGESRSNQRLQESTRSIVERKDSPERLEYGSVSSSPKFMDLKSSGF